MNKFGLLLVTISSLFASACSKTAVVAANFPALFSDQQITRNIEFGSDNHSKLDVYVPADNQETHPVIVFFYGGKWEMGSRKIYRFAAEAFTSRGYVVVIPDYIKYPKAKFPAWQEDAAKAVAWVHGNIGKYKGNPEQIVLMGHSAGAQIAALLATDNEYLAKVGGSRSWVKAFAGLAGPYDFTPEDEDLKDMFSTAGDNYNKIRVSNYIDGKQPPMLFLWGKDDKDVGKINIEHVETALKAKGGDYKIIYYDNVDHIDIVAALAVLARSRAPVIDDVDEWFEDKIK